MSQYPGIEKATLLIALDNGGINRGRTKEDQKRELYEFLEDWPVRFLQRFDAWFVTLSDTELEIICAGEESERITFMEKNAPNGCDEFLDDYFNEVD